MTLDRATMEAVHKLRPAKSKPRPSKQALTASTDPRALPNQLDWGEIRLLPTLSLKPAHKNARTHAKKQIKQVANSILQFGWTYPILADEDRIICGHARWEAAKQLGLKEVPVLMMRGLSDAEKRALALADNKIPANAGWDRKLLAEELGELASLLPDCDLSIDITGFEPAEIDGLMLDFGNSEHDSADASCTLGEQPISHRGELWQLGAHRVLCGDACDHNDWARLMGSDRARMLIADGPYNVQISKTLGRGKIKHREFAVASGEMSPVEFTDFLTRWMRLAAQFSHDGSLHFAFVDWRHIGEMHNAGHAVFGPLQNLVVWNKTNGGQGSFYRSQHELIFVYKNGDGPHLNNVELGRHGRNRSNVWTYAGVNTFRQDRLDDLTVHPTVKPVALIADAIKDCTRRGDLVLDPFLGSGTTLLAAEHVGRRAYGLEIDPLYVDVAIRRWQDVTKRDAILVATGQTFDEVTAARSGPESST
ncbi:site-specific DNA-methyltransferase [Bradyrhizobium sacchari]|uniref:Methyltransferase n=1 Tax=Bradyrhizobium sacchari TaxID=1399419 RepID=A0A560JML5_9BRAD|nr:DNA methyltransferase [Bradyrhizobium sacchari]TWB59229.1 DNA modification methylase [Bradyrhizobium sacchari]TWB72411.1 DNA modification methylase [Bradyrhizobium sacchari]